MLYSRRQQGGDVGRIKGFEKHLIFYRPAADGIEVIRVIHGARDIDSVLESGLVWNRFPNQ